MLSPEFEAVELAITKKLPEAGFGGGAVMAHGAGEFKETGINGGHDPKAKRPSP
jgi:hypothetical protein